MKATQAEQQKYNGWKNYETWNVALWLQNDETLYRMARGFAQRFATPSDEHPYKHMIRCYALAGEKTPDGVRYDSPKVSRTEMDAMLRELGL